MMLYVNCYYFTFLESFPIHLYTISIGLKVLSTFKDQNYSNEFIGLFNLAHEKSILSKLNTIK